MDGPTRDAYASHAAEIVARRLRAGPGVSRHFAQAFSPGDRVLDVGAGSGCDLDLLVSEGFTAYGVEPVEQMRSEAVRAQPRLAGRLVEGALPDRVDGLAERLGGPFDGILCSAVLQHLPRAALFDSVFSLRGLLRPGGRLLVSLPAARPGLDAEGRDSLGRLFSGITPSELELLCQRVGFRSIGRWDDEDSLGRDGVRWATLLFELERTGDGASPRPLDRIEAVLQRDRKTSTYKLALLRALTEIATTQARRARWRPDGQVAIPIDAVAELWLAYYWQLFEGDLLLPQMAGEIDAGRHTLVFAAELDALRAHYAKGGLPAFLVDQRGGALDPHAASLLRSAMKKLRTAIQKGPVTHAGRGTSGALFAYERGTVLVRAELWQEITLMSHWVRDSLVVRWAELAARFAAAARSDALAPDRVLEATLRVLLTLALPERCTEHAREVFARIPDKRCVWSDRRLSGGYDIDHIIPFSLWHNNELWNLVPADSRVNNEKRDLLPTRRLLRDRHPIIVDYWQHLSEKMPRRFELELCHLTGGSTTNYEAGFDALAEAVETTALQRGAARWDG